MSKHIAEGGEYFYIFDPTDPHSMWPYGVIEDYVTGEFYYQEVHDGNFSHTPIESGCALIPLADNLYGVVAAEFTDMLREGKDCFDSLKLITLELKKLAGIL